MALPPLSMPPENDNFKEVVSRSIKVGVFHIGGEGTVAALSAGISYVSVAPVVACTGPEVPLCNVPEAVSVEAVSVIAMTTT